MCHRVVCETGRSLADVVSDSYATTLWFWGQSLAAEKRGRLVRRGERLGAASLAAIAFHDPKQLRTEAQQYEDAVGLTRSVEDSVKAGLELMTMAQAFLEREAAEGTT